MKENKPYSPTDDNYLLLGKYIFIQACRDMLGMDGATPEVQREAAEWLLSPNADIFAGQKRAGLMAYNSLKADPEGARARIIAVLNQRWSEQE